MYLCLCAVEAGFFLGGGREVSFSIVSDVIKIGKGLLLEKKKKVLFLFVFLFHPLLFLFLQKRLRSQESPLFSSLLFSSSLPFSFSCLSDLSICFRLQFPQAPTSTALKMQLRLLSGGDLLPRRNSIDRWGRGRRRRRRKDFFVCAISANTGLFNLSALGHKTFQCIQLTKDSGKDIQLQRRFCSCMR